MINPLERIGLANAVAFISLAVSMVALWESHLANRPSIQLRELPVYSTGILLGKDPRYLSLFRFLVSNNGGRAVSLNTISVPKQIDPVLGTSTKTNTAKPVRSVTFFKTNPTEDNPFNALLDRQPNDSILQREDYIIKKKIEPGDTFQINIGLEYRDQYPDIDRLLVALEANFSDGTVIPIRAAIDARIQRRGR